MDANRMVDFGILCIRGAVLHKRPKRNHSFDFDELPDRCGRGYVSSLQPAAVEMKNARGMWGKPVKQLARLVLQDSRGNTSR